MLNICRFVNLGSNFWVLIEISKQPPFLCPWVAAVITQYDFYAESKEGSLATGIPGTTEEDQWSGKWGWSLVTKRHTSRPRIVNKQESSPHGSGHNRWTIEYGIDRCNVFHKIRIGQRYLDNSKSLWRCFIGIKQETSWWTRMWTANQMKYIEIERIINFKTSLNDRLGNRPMQRIAQDTGQLKVSITTQRSLKRPRAFYIWSDDWTSESHFNYHKIWGKNPLCREISLHERMNIRERMSHNE